MPEEKKVKKQEKSAYHLDLEPGVEARRTQWNLILISDIPLSVDFYHTDMLEKVITISGKDMSKRSGGEEVEG